VTCYKPFKALVLEKLNKIIDNQNRMETLIMSKLDDIEAAVDAAAGMAADDATRLNDLVNKAVAMIADLKNGADPVHADAIVTKINSLKDTLSGTVNTVLDHLDAVVNPPAPTPAA
jgi:hypothetical protein